jgi:cell division protein FtsX
VPKQEEYVARVPAVAIVPRFLAAACLSLVVVAAFAVVLTLVSIRVFARSAIR